MQTTLFVRLHTEHFHGIVHTGVETPLKWQPLLGAWCLEDIKISHLLISVKTKCVQCRNIDNDYLKAWGRLCQGGWHHHQLLSQYLRLVWSFLANTWNSVSFSCVFLLVSLWFLVTMTMSFPAGKELLGDKDFCPLFLRNDPSSHGLASFVGQLMIAGILSHEFQNIII